MDAPQSAFRSEAQKPVLAYPASCGVLSGTNFHRLVHTRSGEWAMPVGSERDWPDLPCSIERFLKPHVIEFARPLPTRALDEYEEEEVEELESNPDVTIRNGRVEFRAGILLSEIYAGPGTNSCAGRERSEVRATLPSQEGRPGGRMMSLRSWPILALLAGSCAWAQQADENVALAERFVRAAELHEQSAMRDFACTADKRRERQARNQRRSIRMHRADQPVPISCPSWRRCAIAQLDDRGNAGSDQTSLNPRAARSTVQMSAVKSARAGRSEIRRWPCRTSRRRNTVAVNKFGTTKLYQKLIDEAVMSRSAVARPLIQARIVEIMQRCRGS